MYPKLCAGVVVLTVAAWCNDAHGEPQHLLSESTVVTTGGSRLTLPPGYFLPEDDYVKLDLELKRLQDVETRLTAENASLRASAAPSDGTWVWVASALVLGVAIGYALP